MSSHAIATPPSVSWAQRSARVFLTFNVECEKPDLKFEKQRVTFSGTCEPDHKPHEVVIPLHAEIDPEKSSYVNKGRCIEVVLAKDKIDEEYWPSLTGEKKKPHWLKVDFNRWQDEEEEFGGDGYEMDDMNDMFTDKLGLGGAFGDEEGKDESSAEEEDLPDLE